jgi:hypothetical protein
MDARASTRCGGGSVLEINVGELIGIRMDV